MYVRLLGSSTLMKIWNFFGENTKKNQVSAIFHYAALILEVVDNLQLVHCDNFFFLPPIFLLSIFFSSSGQSWLIVLCGIYNCIGTLLFYSFRVKMRTSSLCFSILQVPRCRIPTLATFWRESFHSLSRIDKNSSSFRLLGSNIYGLERGYNRKWTWSPVFTNAEEGNKTTQQSKPSNIVHEILDWVVSKSDTFSVNKTEINQFHNTEYCES